MEETPEKTRMIMPHQRYESVQTRIQPGQWVLSNRKQFTDYIINQFEPQLDNTVLQKAEDDHSNVGIPSYHSQQRFVAEYLQNDSPYRGMLLYHGLGSGKTAASIATIESMPKKNVAVFVPGSLEGNFQDELEKFSSISQNVYHFHKKPIVWKAFDLTDPRFPEEVGEEKIQYYTFLMEKSAKSPKHIWLSIPKDDVDENDRDAKPFDDLEKDQQDEITKQLENIYHQRYSFHHYNGGLSFVLKILQLLSNQDLANLIYQEEPDEDNPQCLYSTEEIRSILEEKSVAKFVKSQRRKEKTKKDKKDKKSKKSKEEETEKPIGELSASEIAKLIKKLTIRYKYKILQHFITSRKVKNTGERTLYSLFQKGAFKNPLDRKVIIIDEVHNFISRVAGGGYTCKLPYQFMLHAKDFKIIALSGTPAINTPFEIGLLMNLIRGATTTTQFKFRREQNTIENRQKLLKTLQSIPQIDFYQINERYGICYFTQNPFSFIRRVADDGSETVEKSRLSKASEKWVSNRVDYPEFQRQVLKQIEEKTRIRPEDIQTSEFYIFPHVTAKDKISGLEKKRSEFNQKYVDFETNTLKQNAQNQFLSRIFGLVSFFYETTQKTREGGSIFPEKIDIEPVQVPMSNYQFELYCEAREEERKLEKKSGSRTLAVKSDIEKGKASFYRVMSRNYLLFVFPHSDSMVEEGDDQETSLTQLRKWPRHFKKLDEAYRESMTQVQNQQTLEEEKDPILADLAESDDLVEGSYKEYLEKLYNLLDEQKQTFCTFHRGESYDLTVLSPKYVSIIKNIFQSPGVSLCYSQFKTLEGVRVFTLVLQAHGYKPRTFSSSGEMSTEEISIEIGDNPSMVRLQVSKHHYISVRALEMSDDGSQVLFSQTEIIQRLHDIQSQNKDDAITTKKLQEKLWKLSDREEPILDRRHLQWISYLFENHDEMITREGQEKGIWLPMKRSISKKEGEEDGEETLIRQACYLVWESGTDLTIFRAEENSYGQICQLIFVTLAGAEGISLYAVRQVHLMEPFWNEVKVNQVIGRARRIASHLKIPQQQRNVHVYRYIGTLSQQQKKGDWGEDQKHLNALSETMRVQDKNETSDEYLKDIADRKQRILDSFLDNLKKAAIDCRYHGEAHSMEHGLGIQCASTEALPDENGFIWLPTDKDIQKDIKKSSLESERESELELFVDYVDPLTKEPYRIRILLYPQSGAKKIPIFDWYFVMGFTDHTIGEVLGRGEVARYPGRPIGEYHVDTQQTHLNTIRFLRDRKTLDYFKQVENFLAESETCQKLNISSKPSLKEKCISDLQDSLGTEHDVEGDIPEEAEELGADESKEGEETSVVKKQARPVMTEGPLLDLLGLSESKKYSTKKIQFLFLKKERNLLQSSTGQDELEALQSAMTQYLEFHRNQ